MSADSGNTLSSEFHRDCEYEPGVNGPLLCAIYEWASAHNGSVAAQPLGIV